MRLSLTIAIGLGAATLAGPVLLADAWPYEVCETAWLHPDFGGHDDGFGHAVAAFDGWAAAAAPSLDWPDGLIGGVYVYRVRGDRVTLDTILSPQDPSMISLGFSLEIDGSRLLAALAGGPPGFVFEHIDGAWTLEARLYPMDTWGNIKFGWGADLDGDRAVIGAPNNGPTFVFERQPDGTWIETAQLRGDDMLPSDSFGWDVALSGDVVIVGSRDADPDGWNSGAAYIFEHDGRSGWQQTAKLLPHDGIGVANFGMDVDVEGALAIVGAQGAASDGVIVGAAYIFERQRDGTWVEIQKLVASDAHLSQEFGSAVDFNGDRLIVGALHDRTTGPITGAAYIFERGPDGVWREIAKMIPDAAGPYDKAGSAVALADGFAVVGAFRADIHATDSGAASIFAVGPDVNGNGVADPCECLADIDGDAVITLHDLGALLATYGRGPDHPLHDPRADLNRDGAIDQQDLAILLADYGHDC
jgi:hypothetical protein